MKLWHWLFLSFILLIIGSQFMRNDEFNAYLVSKDKGEIAVSCEETWDLDGFFMCEVREPN